MKFWIRIGTKSESVSLGKLDADKYYHMVATYNSGTGKVNVYLDGNLVASEVKTGTFNFPSNTNAHWFGIGGSSSPTIGESRYPLDGDVVFGRLYSKELDQDDVRNLWEQIINRQSLENIDQVVSELERLRSKTTSSEIATKIAEGEMLMANYNTTQEQINEFIASAKEL